MRSNRNRLSGPFGDRLKDGDYEAFERILNEGLQKFPVD